MIDRHVHIEKGPYTEEWIMEFVKKSQEMDIDKLFLLEHSHRFIEFEEIYDSIKKDSGYGNYQKEWLEKKCTINIKDYQNFIISMKDRGFPIEVYFGLEVCYFPEKEKEIKQILSTFDYDFITGSIHWIDGWGFDHPTTKKSWRDKDIDNVYVRYYNLMIQLVKSKMFDVLAHPDSIKCFNYYSNKRLSQIYIDLAKTLVENNVKAEFNNGLYINYGHNELGTNRELLKILIDNGVEIVTASDAHRPEDVGKYIKEATDIILNYSIGNI